MDDEQYLCSVMMDNDNQSKRIFPENLYSECRLLYYNKVRSYLQGCHSNRRMKFPDFSLIFPGVFKKNSSPAIFMYIGDSQCKMRLRIQLKLTLRPYVKAYFEIVLELNKQYTL